MTDIVDSKRRSELMAGIRTRDTAPELAVRRIAHRMGWRFRLHRKDLPGRPDLVFPRHRLVVFVHGCFWHRHEGCRYASTPKSRIAFWTEKFATNVARDARQEAALSALGWRVLVIWECESRHKSTVERRLATLSCAKGATPELESGPVRHCNGTSSLNTGSGRTDTFPLGTRRDGFGLVCRTRCRAWLEWAHATHRGEPVDCSGVRFFRRLRRREPRFSGGGNGDFVRAGPRRRR